MSWNPKSGIAMFEPGCIRCATCGWKSDDPWDDSPDGFTYDGEWVCDECALPKFTIATNPSESECAGVRE